MKLGLTLKPWRDRDINLTANYYRIDTDEDNRVSAIHWYDRDHVSHRATARAFVVAGNAMAH